MLKILVLCTGNSCRSVMAEGVLNHYGKGKILAFSAGSLPTGTIHPMSLATLKRHGMDHQGYRSKSWDEFTDKPIDILITVCDSAAGEVCPIFPDKPIKAHWSVADPAYCQGTTAEIESEFERVFSLLEQRVKAFLSLPLGVMDKDELCRALNEIGGL